LCVHNRSIITSRGSKVSIIEMPMASVEYVMQKKKGSKFTTPQTTS